MTACGPGAGCRGPTATATNSPSDATMTTTASTPSTLTAPNVSKIEDDIYDSFRCQANECRRGQGRDDPETSPRGASPVAQAAKGIPPAPIQPARGPHAGAMPARSKQTARSKP